MKKRVVHIETNIALRCASQLNARHVLVLVDESDWRFVETPGFQCVYASTTKSDGVRPSVYCRFDALPFEANAFDLVILPHVLKTQCGLRELMLSVDHCLKPSGRCLFFGFNRSEQYEANAVRRALKAKHYLIHAYRGFELLPFLGDALSNILDEVLGRYCPVLSGAYWLLAEKRVHGVTPLKVNFKTVKPPLDVKVKPMAGRLFREQDES